MATADVLFIISYTGRRSPRLSMRRLLAIASAILIAGKLAAAEGDIAACADKNSPDILAACTRLIEGGQLPPDKLAEMYDHRAGGKAFRWRY
jgi:hypothetical protein